MAHPRCTKGNGRASGGEGVARCRAALRRVPAVFVLKQIGQEGLAKQRGEPVLYHRPPVHEVGWKEAANDGDADLAGELSDVAREAGELRWARGTLAGQTSPPTPHGRADS